VRLLELRLQNFRQHADTVIQFAPGLTGIIGPNGAGKSTLLEAIAWAVYGSEAVRGTNDTLRFVRAASRARVRVELRFELGGHEYRVARTPTSAEAFLDGGSAPVATTVGGVTRYLQSRLGMSRREFFNTYFTGQKELQFLATMGPAERGRFLSTVLGYERLRLAQEAARARRSELRHEIEALRGGLGDVDAIEAELHASEMQLRDARSALSAAEGERALAAAAVSTLAPRWSELQGARERQRELTHAVEAAERDRDAARRELTRAEGELARICEAEHELEPLTAELARLPEVAAEAERLERMARAEERRGALERQRRELREELARSVQRMERVEKAPSLLERFAGELAALRAERATVEAEREERNTRWREDLQDARTSLRSHRDRSAELERQISQLREAGPAGLCPTCQRPLGADFERLLGELDDQLALSRQDEKWWAAREKQLAERPPELTQAEARLHEADRALADRQRKHTRCEAAVQELRALQEERAHREERVAALEGEVESLPRGYDPDTHAALEAKLRELRQLETRAARLDEVASRRHEQEAQRDAALQAASEAADRAGAAAEERRAIGLSEEAFAAARTEYEQANLRLHDAELRATQLRGRVETAEQVRAAAERGVQAYRRRAAEVEQRERELRHHNELDAALSQLRSDLNAQLRPELSEIASVSLAQLTDGRYTSLELDDAYNILILDEGEEKPVISGGEEDVANLVLRLSLSQMIAERAGHPLSLLILDEVFGSLDVARRDNVVQLLRRLDDRFEQVILITHVEGMRESLDQVLHVSFDERTGASVVRDETVQSSAFSVQSA
jgi:DNA repair protein SbcC/Rad50